MSSLLDALLLEPHPLNVWIAYRTDGIKGSGTHNDPYDGSSMAKFDAIMSGLPDAPVRLHLGPGTFQTGGFYLGPDGTPGTAAWQPRANMAIVGSGFEITNLKLMPDTGTSGRHYFAIGRGTTTRTDFLEISNLTIDCNLPSSGAIACGAIRVMGNHVRVRNVKCVNWGNRTSGSSSIIGFVIALIIADPDASSPSTSVDDAGIQDCIALDPGNNVSGAVVNVFHVGGRELGSGGAVSSHGKASFIRNCFVDCGSPTSSAVFQGLSMSGCHGGVVEGNQVHNTMYGGPIQQKLNTRELIVRNNHYRNVIKGPLTDPASSSFGVQKLLVEGNNIDLIADSPSGSTPVGIHVVGNVSSSVYWHGQVIIRNNKIRYLDAIPGSFNGYGIDVSGAESLLISDNVIDVAPSNPIRSTLCGAVKYFNNRQRNGTLVRGWNSTSGAQFQYGELETDAEDAFVLGLLEKR